ncbi:hypothetical protein F7731_20855 [Cytobacillus depressus]|uniref:Uncharacterized protein n=1 Tax=Cytobacillus depressus TaxID=1602942 RepID=A0A6L3V098_9BACI|nr:hypothetical protein [Cytobacillus depressus]KAB2330230.1 hypothetical protein F7731_20855 [Cytobacillus depressus]
MLEFFMDASNIPADYTIYMSLVLGLMMKYLWVWSIEYSFHDSQNDINKIDSLTILPEQHFHFNSLFNPVLHWITKCARKKDGLGDDPDSEFSYLLT